MYISNKEKYMRVKNLSNQNAEIIKVCILFVRSTVAFSIFIVNEFL